MTALIQDVVQGFEDFFASEYADGGLMRRLAVKGQRPIYLSFACMDSRTTPEIILRLHSGQSLDIRLGGPVIPRHAPGDPVSDLVEEHLQIAVSKGVRHILLVGHEDCAAAGKISCTCGQPASALEKMGAPFLEAAKVAAENDTPESLHRAVEKQIVILGLEHLMSYPCVQAALNENALHIHGLLFSLKGGNLSKYYPENGEFRIIAGENSTKTTQKTEKIRA